VTGLSPDLLSQSARRLRIVALLYAFVFFMSDPFQAILFSESQRTELPLSEGFDRLILACLEKSPDARPPTADALAEQLAALETRSAWTMTRARQWWDVHHPAKTRVA
jgi:hypothetical protein